MADEHMDIIPASENDDSDTEPFAQLMALNPESDDSDNSSAFGNGLLEVVNEHNEVLGVIQRPVEQEEDNELFLDEQDNNLHPEQLSTNAQDPIPPDMQDYEPPPLPDEMFSNSESDSDTPDYYLQSSDEEEPTIPQVRVPLRNYSRDVEHPEDFAHNWLWLEQDTGSSYSPFTGNPGMNIRPTQPDALGYFHLFFEQAMYTRLAAQTNEYARQRIQNITGYIVTRYLLDIYSIITWKSQFFYYQFTILTTLFYDFISFNCIV